jgi:hypothetical protein
MNSAQTKPGKTLLALLELLNKEAMQLGELVAPTNNQKFAIDRAQPLGESLFFDGGVDPLISLVELLLGLAWIFPQAENHGQLMGSEPILLACTNFLQEYRPTHRQRGELAGMRAQTGWGREHTLSVQALDWLQIELLTPAYT